MAEMLGPPPAGGDANQGASINAMTWVLTVITTLIYAGRIYTRAQITKDIGIGDYLVTFSLVLLYGLSAATSISIHHGLGRHQYYISLPELFKTIEWQTISIPLAIICSLLPKIAITMNIIRILAPPRRSIIWLWTLNIMVISISVTCSLVHFIQCVPASAAWEPIGQYACWDARIVNNIGITQGSVAAFADFSLALFPVAALWRLQMPLRTKISVAALLAVGCFAGIAALVRTVILTTLGSSSDFSWDSVKVVIWITFEANVTLICACIPTLRPLWRLCFSFTTSTRSEYTGNLRSSFTSRIRMKSNKSAEAATFQEYTLPLQTQTTIPDYAKRTFSIGNSTFISFDSNIEAA